MLLSAVHSFLWLFIAYCSECCRLGGSLSQIRAATLCLLGRQLLLAECATPAAALLQPCRMMHDSIKLVRAFDLAKGKAPKAGTVLVDALWPRGIKKQNLPLDVRAGAARRALLPPPSKGRRQVPPSPHAWSLSCSLS